MALSMVEGIGDVLYRDLVSRFGSPRAVMEASLGELRRAGGVGEKTALAIKGFDDWDRVDHCLEVCDRVGVDVVVVGGDGYPPNLAAIYNPPPLLYVRGELLPTDSYAVAVVGSRAPDRYGRTVAEGLGAELARRGITVVSGMARGIDSIAHRAALKAGGRTVAVLGCGIDVVYPPENARLYEKISMQGACITEFHPGTRPESVNFPRRNRVISGLSLGVVVVEASAKSGSLITAAFALEQGREVFAVPGEITKGVCRGSNRLIKAGAKLVEDVDDIVEEIAELREYVSSGARGNDAGRAAVMEELTPDERAICEVLRQGVLSIDEIAELTGLGTSKALASLLALELKGLVVQHQGKLFEMKL